MKQSIAYDGDYQNNVNLYTKHSTEAGRSFLIQLLGKDYFASLPITDRIKTFEDACKATDKDGKAFDYCEDDSEDTKSILAYAKLVIISKALNEGWVPDWDNPEEYKYIPWFSHVPGFGLSLFGCAGWPTSTSVSSRICYKTKELAEYAARQFESIYRDYLTINQ